MTYREIDLTKDNEQAVMMMMWYRELVGELKNPLHQSEWPLGIIEKKDMKVRYIGAFDPTPNVGVGQVEVLAGMIGYTTVCYDEKCIVDENEIAASSRRNVGTPRNDSVRPLAIFEIMMFVREEYRGKGIGGELWRRLAELARDQGLPLWVGNNTEGGDASLRKAIGKENVQIHKLTVVPGKPIPPKQSLDTPPSEGIHKIPS